MLLGTTAPSGRLPFTWPKRYADLQFQNAAESWPGVDGDVHYTEGTAVGYRWYSKHDVQPQWWFGHGVGYSSFQTQALRVAERADGDWDVHVRVKNTGSDSGQEVIQLYSYPEHQQGERELRAFDKTKLLDPGAEESLLLIVRKRDLAHWQNGLWRLEAGEYALALGENAGAVSTAAVVHIEKTLTWQP